MAVRWWLDAKLMEEAHVSAGKQKSKPDKYTQAGDAPQPPKPLKI
jgi:hypothetical protein